MPTVFSNPPRKGQPARIWHLDDVLELAKHLPVFQQPLAELKSLDEVAWYGDGHHYGRLTVREVADHSRRIQEATLERPIVLSCEGWLMDGFHRVAKAHLEGLNSLPAVQFVEDPPPNRISTWHDWHEATLRD
jgi:hypothetical protein